MDTKDISVGKKVVLNKTKRDIQIETNRVIRKIMDVIERYTDYQTLDEDRRAIVRDTVLNQINKLVRITRNKHTMIFDK